MVALAEGSGGVVVTCVNMLWQCSELYTSSRLHVNIGFLNEANSMPTKVFPESGHKSCSGWAEAQSSVLPLRVISRPDPGTGWKQGPSSCRLPNLHQPCLLSPFRSSKSSLWGAHPDRERTVLAANSTAAVRAAGLRRTPILLLLFEDFWVEFLKPNNKC